MNIFFNIKYFDESDKMLYLSAVLTALAGYNRSGCWDFSVMVT